MKAASTTAALLLGLGVALLPGCGKGDRPAAGPPANLPARAVRVATVESRPMERVIPATGTLAAQEASTLSAKVAGRLQRIPVDLGSVVGEGDLLAQIEPRDFELRQQQAKAALAQARVALGLPLEGDDDEVKLEEVSSVKQAHAVLDEAAKTRERVLSLARTGIASQAEVDTVEASHTVARARYDTALEEARTRMAVLTQRRAEFELARKQLADTSVRAPFAGVVQSRPAGVGEYVSAGTAIVRLVKADPLRLRLEVPERDSAAVRAGQTVRLRVEGDTNLYTGQLARLSPALDEATRMLLIEADVPARGPLRPGLFARAEIVVETQQPGLSIPLSALLSFAGIEKVVLARAGKAQERTVVTGRRGPDWVEIISGLAAGDVVVLDPAGLRTGQPLTVGDLPPGSGTNGTKVSARLGGARLGAQVSGLSWRKPGWPTAEPGQQVSGQSLPGRDAWPASRRRDANLTA